ncbi:MAG TPA: 1,2-phenylacetyl-CoA epoxidase subunit PaaC [Candidatus Aquilonibacter sp.]
MNAGAVDHSRFEFLLRAGDNGLILGQRLVALLGHAPVLEEELGIANVALDLLGHARMWLSYAGEVEGAKRTEDDMAFFRNAGEFRNALLVEQPNGSFADTIVRQFLFDAWHVRALGAWSASADERIAAIAQKAKPEADYHLTRSCDWVVRLGDGTDESHARMQAALVGLWPYTSELFAADGVDRDLAARGIVAPEDLREAWLHDAQAVFARATLAIPDDAWAPTGGKRGLHTEHLSYLLAEMQSLRRSVPGERW